MTGSGPCSRSRTKIVAIAAAGLVPLAAAALTGSPAAADNPGQTQSQAIAPQTVTVDGTSPGRVFDGVGALSAGATSVLLRDYPAQQRSQILDYLFKPDYGANLQILKVEIGGDTNSTDGTEPSHMRTPTHVNCNLGYEWWLMEQAKARNPDIKLAALEWGAPGWVGGTAPPARNTPGRRTVWTDRNIDYIISWLGCARQHGLTIDYLGGWNESGYNTDWYIALRHALDDRGYGAVKVVADDDFGWGVANAMASDPAFNKAVDVVGKHYPCGYLNTPVTCDSPAAAQELDKPLWASEQGSEGYDTGAIALARDLNLEYVTGKMTGTINWSLIWSAYAGLPFEGAGLMEANTPWSGNYVVGKSIWVMAHTAQFTQPGWRYVDSASTTLSGGGSVATLRAPGGGEWSSVVDATGAAGPQQLTYDVTGGLSTSTVHVWATNLDSNDSGQWFNHVSDIQPVNGAFSMSLQPGYLYTLTTTSGQQHGSATAPSDHPWRLPYGDNFEGYQDGGTPHYFSDLGGSFQTAACVGRQGMCLQQNVTDQPVQWNLVDNFPVTVVGDPQSWTNYDVSVDAYLPKAGHVGLDGRLLAPPNNQTNGLNGYHFQVGSDGKWSIYSENAAGTDTTLAAGTTSFAVGAWHNLGLELRGDEITASVDHHRLGTVVDSSYAVGQVGVEGSPWVAAQYDNLNVSQVPVNGKGPVIGQIDPAQIPLVGGSGQVSATVTNPGTAAATDISAQLQAPDGWQVTTVAPPRSELDPGESAPLSWRVTPPDTATPGAYQAKLVITYREAGLSWTSSATVPIYLQIVPQPQMTATATSAQDGYPASNAIDGDPNTLWHTEYSPSRAYPPQSITLDLGKSYDIGRLLYLPRQDNVSNGIITSYKIFVSSDGTNFTQAATGDWPLNASQKTAQLDAQDVRYVRLEGDQGGGSYVSAAEINVELAAPVSLQATTSTSIIQPDQSASVTVTATNTSSQAVHQLALKLTAPSDWTVTATEPTTFANVAPGQAVQSTWTVAAPADQQPGSVRLPVLGTYQTEQEGNAATNTQVTFAVPYRSLAAAYNDVGITNDSDTSVGNLAYSPGYSYSEQALEAVGLSPGATVHADGATLTWPDVPAGQPDNVIAQGQTIPLSGDGANLVLLGASNQGNGSGAATITYTDGSTQTFTLRMSNWSSNSPVAGDQLVATTSHWNAPPGAGSYKVSVYSTAVPLQSGKNPAYLTLPSGATGAAYMWVFAAGIG